MADDEKTVKTRMMVPTLGVTVGRNGQPVSPTIGQAFAFTQDEINDINDRAPGALRKPKNEVKESDIEMAVGTSDGVTPGGDDGDDAAVKKSGARNDTDAKKTAPKVPKAEAEDAKGKATGKDDDDL